MTTSITLSTAHTAIAIILLESGARITAELAITKSTKEWLKAMAEIGRADEVRSRRNQIIGLIYISFGTPSNYNRAEALECLDLE